MTLQARMKPDDPRLYNVSRDVAHNFAYVVEETAKRCEQGGWQELDKLAKDWGTTPEDVGRACQALCRFVLGQLDTIGESMPNALARCGWFDVPTPARAYVMAYMGTIVLGMNWAGVHEATIGGEGPILTYKRLRYVGMRCVKLMSMPRWKRKLYCLSHRIRMAWRTFWEKDQYAG